MGNREKNPPLFLLSLAVFSLQLPREPGTDYVLPYLPLCLSPCSSTFALRLFVLNNLAYAALCSSSLRVSGGSNVLHSSFVTFPLCPFVGVTVALTQLTEFGQYLG